MSEKIFNDDTAASQTQFRLVSLWGICLLLMNSTLIISTFLLSYYLWANDNLPLGIIATAVPQALHVTGIASIVAGNVVAVYENIGVVQDGLRSIGISNDTPNFPHLLIKKGHIEFDDVWLSYKKHPEDALSTAVSGQLRSLS